jgi:outer membrane protein
LLKDSINRNKIDMMNNKALIFLLIVLCFIGGYTLYKTMKISEVKYVRSADLIYGYVGMKEAQEKQQSVKESQNARLDTLQMDFQLGVNQYNKDYATLSKQERETREKLLTLQQNNLEQYSRKIENIIKEQDLKLTEGVLNQVNAFVEEYAKAKGYDLILGTTTSGNILYAKHDMDITKEVLEALNEHYKGK